MICIFLKNFYTHSEKTDIIIPAVKDFRKNPFIIAILAICSVLIVIVFIFSLVQVVNISGALSVTSPECDYHIALYLPDVKQTLFADILEGAEQFCRENSIALSVHTSSDSNNTLFAAPYIGADGIVIYSASEARETAEILDTIISRQIPLVLIGHGIPTNNPYCSIGVNNFELGRNIGEYAVTVEQSLRPAIVYSEKSPGMYLERELLEMGFNSVADQYLDQPVITERTTLNSLDAEESVIRLLEEHPDINMIFFTNSDDTLSAAKMMVDFNMVGRIRTIGFSGGTEISEYLEKGIIDAVVVVDGYTQGYRAMESVYDICRYGNTASFVNTGFDFVTNPAELNTVRDGN